MQHWIEQSGWHKNKEYGECGVYITEIKTKCYPFQMAFEIKYVKHDATQLPRKCTGIKIRNSIYLFKLTILLCWPHSSWGSSK